MYKGVASGFRGKIKDALHDLEDCLRIFEGDNSVLDVAKVLREIAAFYATECRMEEALSALRRCIALYEGMKDPHGQVETYVYAGNVYFNFGFNTEAIDSYGKAIRIGEKIGEYNRMAWASLYLGLLNESVDNFHDALTHSLKAIEFVDKTDSYYVQSMSYANMTRNCVKLEDLEHAEEYYNKFTKLFEETSRTASQLAKAVGVRTEAVYFAAKNQWNQANEHFEESLKLYKEAVFVSMHEAMTRTDYAWALKKQGRATDAKVQIEEAKKLHERLGNRLQVERLDALLGKINEPI